jgi:hypothetical protein
MRRFIYFVHKINPPLIFNVSVRLVQRILISVASSVLGQVSNALKLGRRIVIAPITYVVFLLIVIFGWIVSDQRRQRGGGVHAERHDLFQRQLRGHHFKLGNRAQRSGLKTPLQHDRVCELVKID